MARIIEELADEIMTSDRFICVSDGTYSDLNYNISQIYKSKNAETEIAIDRDDAGEIRAIYERDYYEKPDDSGIMEDIAEIIRNSDDYILVNNCARAYICDTASIYTSRTTEIYIAIEKDIDGVTRAIYECKYKE